MILVSKQNKYDKAFDEPSINTDLVFINSLKKKFFSLLPKFYGIQSD